MSSFVYNLVAAADLRSTVDASFDVETSINWHSLMYTGGTDTQASNKIGCYLPATGTSGYIQTPDAAAIDLSTDNFAFVAKVALDDWTPTADQMVLSKYGTTNEGYFFQVRSTGHLRFGFGTGSGLTVASNSSIATGLTNGESQWISCTKIAGSARYFLGGSGDTPSWSQLGTNVFVSNNTISTAGEPLEIGSYSEGATGRTTGITVEHVRIYSTAPSSSDPEAGTLNMAVDFTAIPSAAGRTNAQEIATDSEASLPFTAYGTGWFWTLSELANETGESAPTQATASARPEWVVGDSNFNSQPVVSFDGTNDQLSTAAFSTTPSGTWSVVVVAKADDTVGAQTIVGGTTSGTRAKLYLTASSWAIYQGSLVRTGGTSDTNTHLFVVKFSSTDTLHVDGISTISGNAGTATWTSGMRMGDEYDSSQPFGGQVAFVGVYPGDITADGQWSAFNTWLKTTYGLVTVDNFDPETDLSNVHSLFWAEGSSMSGYSDTDPVGTWYNETGESDATATDGVTYAASSSGLNSKPAVRFDGGNCDLSTSAFSVAPSYTSGVTIIVVAKYDSVGNNQFLIDGIASGNRNVLYPSGGNWAIFAGSTQSGSAYDSNAHLFVAQFDGSTGTDTLDIDGTNQINADAGSHTLTGLSIGHWYSNSGNDFDGDMALVILIEGDATADANWAVFEGWCESHYGLTIA